MKTNLLVLTIVASLFAAAGPGEGWAAKPPRNEAPTVTAFDVPDNSSSPVPVVTLTASDGDGTVTGYLVTETAVQPDAGDPDWSATKPSSYATSAVGVVTLYAWAKDNDNAVSAGLSDTVSIPDPLEQRVAVLEAEVQVLKVKTGYICDLYDLIGNSAAAPAFCQSTETKTVFASSQEYQGNLGSVAAYDGECQALAATAGLPGTYLAWISNGSEPAQRFTRSTSDYVLVDGTVVANGWSDLVDGALDNAIALTESGLTPLGSNEVWTGTNRLGVGMSPPGTCEGWIDIGGLGWYGSWSAVNIQWTDFSDDVCSALKHIYCFEQ